MKQKTYYVIRSGWNAANQSSRGCVRNPKNQFESGQYKLVGIVTAESGDAAVAEVSCSCYQNQIMWTETNPRSIRGLTQAIRYYRECEAEIEEFEHAYAVPI